jgi:glutamate formiminotransferase/formiminotetrahydrofolate cyclodeaminase
MKLVECVPNVSEGRDKAILQELSKTIEAVSGVSLLDVDPGADTNRTVFTFVGAPDVVAEAAFLLIKRAAELIDMRKHKGAHSRIGATDVTPFIPLSEMSMEECVALAKQLGGRVGKELEIPVYLYEAAASRPERRNLADIRKGEYEGLGPKLQDAQWKPDFGPAAFSERQQKSGASVIGARPFLVAYNVNLNTRDKKVANEIAFNVRESGRAKKDDKGGFVLDGAGAKVMVPGTLPSVKATGWVIDSYGCAQVSMNLTNLAACGIAKAFDECERQAQLLGARVTGSELVGLLPKDELVLAGKHFLKKMGKPTFLPERELMEIAVRSMGLSEIAPFEIDKKVIELRVQKPRRLAETSVQGFADQLSTDSPAPGGGSVAALLGALAAALGSMVAAITAQKKDYAAVLSEVSELGSKAQALKQKLVFAIDDDTDAFNAVLDAMRMPKGTPDEQALRTAAMEKANQGATLVPLEVMRLALEALRLNAQLAGIGFKQSQTDAGVGALAAMTALEGAFYNVRTNLPGVTDEAFKKRVKQDGAALFAEAEGLVKKARAALEASLAG